MTFLLTEYLGREPLKGRLSRLVNALLHHRPLGLLRRRHPNIAQDLQITKALAGELALHLDLLPALEVFGRGPVAEKAALGVGYRRLKLGLDHVWWLADWPARPLRRLDGDFDILTVVDGVLQPKIGRGLGA